MIYADTSFLFSLYALDSNSASAVRIYESDARRPLIFTPWQRFELRNTVRLAAHRLKRAGGVLPFSIGNAFKQIDEDLKSGVLRHAEPDWRETFRLAESVSDQLTLSTGAGGVDTWHIASAILLQAEVFWTFDDEQADMASRLGKFKAVKCVPAS